jgi:hypothetical protein
MVFITSLVTAIGAAYLYEKSEKTYPLVAIACVPIAMLSLLSLLIFAPWQIQLLLLIGVLVSYHFIRSK